jgi:molybdopterin converting factor subunit 1
MKIRIRFFASYRQLVGQETVELEVAEQATIADVIERLERDYPQFGGKLRHNALVALNEVYAEHHQYVQPQDTIAFFPPVSGG